MQAKREAVHPPMNDIQFPERSRDDPPQVLGTYACHALAIIWLQDGHVCKYRSKCYWLKRKACCGCYRLGLLVNVPGVKCTIFSLRCSERSFAFGPIPGTPPRLGWALRLLMPALLSAHEKDKNGFSRI